MIRSKLSLVALVALPLTSVTAQVVSSAPATLTAAVPNDNRTPGGTMQDGVLTLRLVVQWSAWTLNSSTARGLPMLAFAEEGGGPTIPGPVIRVRAGTRVRVSVRNPLPGLTLVVRGLSSHSTDERDSLVVASGATEWREFTAESEGTFFYWGAISDANRMERRFGYDSQLNGAFVVDPASARSPQDDRIFLMTLWSDSTTEEGDFRLDREFWAINGVAWPETERLSATVGDSIRWRVINASGGTHPMHLHGFYFRVDALGANGGDTVYAAAKRRMVVTEKLRPGMTMQLVWSPDRPGGWVFHCHMTVHLLPAHHIAGQAEASHDHDPIRHTEQGMAGLILGIDVHSAPGSVPNADPRPRRQLRMVVHSDSAATDKQRRFAAILQEGSVEPAPDSMRVPGSALILTRGEPATIRVVNHSGEPTSIHWHGIELESYYDGVVGVGGMPGMRTPPVMPGDSFDVLVTPPRSGSFMYHTHVDDVRQQNGGFYGPFIVLEPGVAMDPEHDMMLMSANSSGGVVLNGSATPTPVTLRVGRKYRLRIANISTSAPNLFMQVVRDSAVVEWRAVAKDGFELAAGSASMKPARQYVSNGEIYDFEVTPDRLGELTYEVRSGSGRLLNAMAMRVVP